MALVAIVFVSCSQDVVTSSVETTVPTASRAITGNNLVGTTITLKASNGLYVCSEIRDENAPLEADRDKAATWETFEVVDAGDGFIAFVAYNGNYICADKNFSGTPLLANRTAIGSWEKFTWIDHGDGTASIQANVNGKYWKHSNDSTDDYTITAGAYTMHSATIFEYNVVEGSIDDGTTITAPSEIINTDEWKLTTPFKDGDDSRSVSNYEDRLMPADEFKGSSFEDYTLDGYFDIVDNGIRFRAHCGGATTSGSKYIRSELRQQVGGGDNYWSASDYQKMVTVSAITEVPVVKPEVCIAQIHGGEDEPLRIQYTAPHSRAPGKSDITTNGVYILQNPDADSFDDINSENKNNALSYELGQKIQTTIIVDNGEIYCKIENLATGESQDATWIPKDSSENYDGTGYFKAGMYTQSSMFLSQFKSEYDEDEGPDTAGEMILYSMSLTETY